jgi:hypothetical protein
MGTELVSLTLAHPKLPEAEHLQNQLQMRDVTKRYMLRKLEEVSNLPLKPVGCFESLAVLIGRRSKKQSTKTLKK